MSWASSPRGGIRLPFECRTGAAGRYDGDAHVCFARKIEEQTTYERLRAGLFSRALWVVLNTYLVRRCPLVRGQKKRLVSQDIYFFFLATYCQGMNGIKDLWLQVGYRNLADHSYKINMTLMAAVQEAPQIKADAMRNNTTIAKKT